MSLLLLSGGLPRIRLLGPGLRDPRLSFARAQLAGVESTYLGPDAATWQTAAADVLRFQGAGRRALFEGQRTNLLPNARTPFGTGWSNAAIASTASAVGPDGQSGSALLVTEDTSTNAHSSALNASLTSGQSYAISFLAAPGTCLNVQILGASGGFGLEAYCNFVLTGAGSVGTKGTAVTRANIQKIGSFYWCEMVAPATATVGSNVILAFGTTSSNSRNPSFAGTSRTITVGYAWCEAGFFASTPTLPPVASPAASTRGADLASATLASLGIGGNGACTALWSGVVPNLGPENGIQPILNISDGTTNNRITASTYNAAGSGVIRLIRVTGGAASSGTAGTFVAGTPFALGLSCDGSGGALLSVGGAASFAVAGSPAAGLTSFAHGTAAGSYLYGEIAYLDVIPRPVSDAQLQRLVAAMPV